MTVSAGTAAAGWSRDTLSALLTMLVTQAVVVAAALAAPVLGPAVAADLGVPPATVGWYASAVFGGALLSAQVAPRLIAGWGPLRISQAAALLAAAGLTVAAVEGGVAGMVLSALAIGFAYAPGNPASSSLLSATVPVRLRALVFSLKQTAVPIGGAIAGIAAPLMAEAAGGWRGAFLGLAALALVVALGVQPFRARLDGLVAAPAAPRASPLRLIAATPALRRMAVVAGCLASVQFSVAAVFATFLSEVAGIGLLAAGSVLSAAMGTSVALRIGLGWAADRVGGGRVLAATAAMIALSAFLCLLLAAGALPGAFALAGLVAGALAAGAYSWNGVYLSEVATSAPAGAVASATAGTMSFVFLGGFVGPAVFTAATFAAGGYAGGFAALTALAVLATLALARRGR